MKVTSLVIMGLFIAIRGQGVKIYRYVHRMVALAFLGEPVGKMDVNHKDGNKKNNSLSNLEWCTRSENQIHAFSTGVRTDIGERKYNSVLSESKVRIFRHLYDNKIADEKEMAKMFGVNQATLSDAVKRRTWRHI
jgi:hypothetical protein